MPPSLISIPRPCTASLESPPRGTTRTGNSTGWRNQRRVFTGEDIFSHRPNRGSDGSPGWAGSQDYEGFSRPWLLVTDTENADSKSLVILSTAKDDNALPRPDVYAQKTSGVAVGPSRCPLRLCSSPSRAAPTSLRKRSISRSENGAKPRAIS